MENSINFFLFLDFEKSTSALILIHFLIFTGAIGFKNPAMRPTEVKMNFFHPKHTATAMITLSLNENDLDGDDRLWSEQTIVVGYSFFRSLQLLWMWK